MSAPVNLIEGHQDDIVARLGAASYFTDVVIVQMRKGVTLAELQAELSQYKKTGGKLPGVAVIVFLPDRVPVGNQGSLQWLLRSKLTVHEIPRINRKTGGCGKLASSVSLKVEDLLNEWVIGGSTLLVTKVDGYADAEGEMGFDITAEWRCGQTFDARCRAPRITGTPAAVTITNNETGATVYYTTDGSLPTAANGTAYSTPFACASDTLVRAVAYKTGKEGSHVAEETMNYPAASLESGGLEGLEGGGTAGLEG